MFSTAICHPERSERSRWGFFGLQPQNDLKIIWNKWKKIAHLIGVFQSKVILTIFYFTILLPVGIVFSLFKDALNIKRPSSSNWVTKIKQAETLEEMREQY